MGRGTFRATLEFLGNMPPAPEGTLLMGVSDMGDRIVELTVEHPDIPDDGETTELSIRAWYLDDGVQYEWQWSQIEQRS